MNDGVFIPSLKVPVRQQWNENEDVAPCGAFCPKQILSLQTWPDKKPGNCLLMNVTKKTAPRNVYGGGKTLIKGILMKGPGKKWDHLSPASSGPLLGSLKILQASQCSQCSG